MADYESRKSRVFEESTLTSPNKTPEQISGNAIPIQNGGGNTIEGNYIGTDVSGNTAAVNVSQVVFIVGSNGNKAGGTTTAARNIIFGNGQNAVHMALGASGNTEADRRRELSR